jgi:hypothetical protein
MVMGRDIEGTVARSVGVQGVSRGDVKKIIGLGWGRLAHATILSAVEGRMGFETLVAERIGIGMGQHVW